MRDKDRKLNIVYFTTDFPPTVGGISEFTESVVRHLSSSPDIQHIQVVALHNQKNGVEKINERLTVIRNNRNSFIGMCVEVCAYGFRFRNYDVFHVGNIFPLGFIVVFFGKYIFKKPTVVTFYGTDVLTTAGSKQTKLAKGWVLRHATAAVTISESTRKETARHYAMSEQSFSIVPYPLSHTVKKVSSESTQALKKKHGISDDDFVVLFIGHLVRRKGPEDLLEAVSFIKDKKIKLIFVGDGPLKESLELQTKEYGMQDKVVFAGKVPEVAPYYEIAGLFSMPSFFYKEEGDIEGLGIVYLEAQQRGVPVLGTHSGGIPEAIADGRSGFLVSERDTRALAEKIILLHNNENLRKKMGEQGKIFVREKFNWKNSVKKHLEIYKNL